MRLTSDRAKQAILHPLQDVREAAVAYFTTSFDPDPQIMPVVIQAIEQYGERAFEPIPYADKLTQTEETVRWLITRLSALELVDETDDEGYARPVRSLTHALSGADPQLLAAHESEIAALPLSAETHLAIRDRISLLNTRPESLWREWEDFCENYDEGYDPRKPVVARVGRVVEALGRHPEFAGPRVLDVLIRSQQIDDFENNPLGWMEPYAVRLAGLLRLEQAIPVVVAKMGDEDADWLNDECIWALSRIGGDAVVRALSAVVLDRGEDFQFRAAAILEDIHTDYSVQTAVDLLQYDHEALTQVQLFKALLINGAPQIYDTVRQWLHDHERVPDWLDLRADLITSATIMEVDFPELAEWRADMQHDGEFRRQWYAEHYGPLLALNEMKAMQAFQHVSEGLASDQEDDFDDDWDEDFESPHDSDGPLRARPHAGRNDPCPCGSGKKYKKCCYYKDRDANLN